ncbi:MAG: phage Gp37/Gp68 family protein [Polyangiaceae bacterium]|nr:phage Gp37/Gp68 family protein [Polyangiaceae bacterium]
MAQLSPIEWTDASWNPVRGCVKVSPGCKHCYADAFAERFRGVPGHPYEQGFDPRLVPEMLDVPLRWRKPRKIFANSMSDLFADFVPFTYIDAVLVRMLLTPHHTYQVLTKRAARMAEYFARPNLYERVLDEAHAVRHIRPELMRIGISNPATSPAQWVWLGVSVEDRKYGGPRIDELRKVPARVRFLSIEPLLEDLGALDLSGIHWVIVGGESGHGARTCEAEWIRRIIEQCGEQRVPVFVKQGGGAFSDARNGIAGRSLRVAQEAQPLISLRLKHRKGGDLLELPEDLRVREVPR